jgi:hypothetical protein
LINKPEIRHLTGVEEYVRGSALSWVRSAGPKRNTLVAFGITVALWITPGVVALVAGTDSDVYASLGERLDEGIAAIVGAGLLFLLPTDWGKREYTMTWGDAAKIDWGTIVLFGSGIVFGSLLDSTGLAETIGKNAFDLLGFSSSFAITALAVVLAITCPRRRPTPRAPRWCADHPAAGRGGGCQPADAGVGGDVRGIIRVHAPGCRPRRTRSSTARASCRSPR